MIPGSLLSMPIIKARIFPRINTLLESASAYMGMFDRSRGDTADDNGGNQFAYGVATGLLCAVNVLFSTEERPHLFTICSWVRAGKPTDIEKILNSGGMS